MSNKKKQGVALERYKAKRAAKKARSGRKSRRLRKRAEARQQAIVDGEAALERLKAAQAEHHKALDNCSDEATAAAALAAGHAALDAQYALDALAPAYEHAIRSRELEQARLSGRAA